MKNKVNIFIIGAPKCGTTSLYSYLVQTEGVKSSISNIKEPYYFADDLPKIRKLAGFDCGLKEYEDNFDLESKNNIDASVWYLYSNRAVQNIYDYNPNAKIIVMLRNPVDMVYSLFYQHRHRFENIKSFERAWNNYEQRTNNPFKKNIDLKLFDYQAVGKYSEQLERLFSIFPKSQIKLVLFDDFEKDTKKEYIKVTEFLSLEPNHQIRFDKKNVNQVERAALVASVNIFPKKTRLIIKRISLKIFGNSLDSLLIKKEPRIPLSADFQNELKDYYRPEILKLEALLNLNLSNWK
jgi:hypothetical protein